MNQYRLKFESMRQASISTPAENTKVQQHNLFEDADL